MGSNCNNCSDYGGSVSVDTTTLAFDDLKMCQTQSINLKADSGVKSNQYLFNRYVSNCIKTGGK